MANVIDAEVRGHESHASLASDSPRTGPAGPASVTAGAGANVGAGGRFAFAKALDRDAECGWLRASGLMVVELEGVGPSVRGRLGEAIDDALEGELDARGAGGPGIAGDGDARDRDGALGDQLFRARRSGARGIALVLGPLRAAAGPSGALDPEDSATLRFLARATRERPLVVILDERDAATPAYADPVPLAALVAEPPATQRHLDLDFDADLEPGPAPPHDDQAAEDSVEPNFAPAFAAALAHAPSDEAPARAPAPALARHTAGAAVVDREEPWRGWTLQLAAARGPQPLSSLEKLYTDCYVPLASAVANGLDDPRARAATEEFRATFTRGYSEAFPTFASTTKRPRMVLDVHETASRIARLHGARSTRVLLVDAMRWDVSRLVLPRLTARLGDRAVVTDELLLWSALPTTTMRQLETIARGIDALRMPGDVDADAEPPRGRTADYVRRLRVGPRELHKLDLVESRLQGARGTVLRSLPEIADATAEAIARHARTLAPNTLLFVFGDHGFTVDRAGAARQGGASPEEVLVGAFGLLVGDVH